MIKKKIAWKSIITLLGVTYNLGLSLLLCYTFYVAFFNGYQTHVTVNDFGEANIEFVLLIPVMIVGFVSTVLVWSSIICRRK